MTKRRDPITLENTLMRVLGTLTLERAAEVTGRQQRYLHALADPDRREQLTVLDLIKLDAEHMRTAEGEAPLFETVGLILASVRAEIYADAVAINKVAIDVIREGGQAHVALCASSQPNATDAELRLTLTELEESALATTAAIAVVRATLEHRSFERRQQQPP